MNDLPAVPDEQAGHRLKTPEQLSAVYAAVVASAPDAVIVVDDRGVVVAINPAAEETFGYPRAEAVATAQALRVNAVKAQYGSKWSHWVGAKNKAIIFVGGAAATQYQARAMPCFYQPVP